MAVTIAFLAATAAVVYILPAATGPGRVPGHPVTPLGFLLPVAAVVLLQAVGGATRCGPEWAWGSSSLAYPRMKSSYGATPPSARCLRGGPFAAPSPSASPGVEENEGNRRIGCQVASVRVVNPLTRFLYQESTPMSVGNDAVIGNQESILGNQEKILANQQKIERNQAKLDKIVSNQAAIRPTRTIRDNQKKLDKIAANQATILANQESIRDNQDKLDKALANQATIQSNQETILANQDRIEADLREILSNQREVPLGIRRKS